MKKYILIHKGAVCVLLVVLLGMNILVVAKNQPVNFYGTEPFYPSGVSLTPIFEPTTEEGSLSGHITDSELNPVQGARVRVYFHDMYRENYSDATGYYHVTDIPICYCSKNATCSKEGYMTEWVWLSIYETTSYDFVLTPFEGYSYPEFNSTLGMNGWFVRPVLVTFVGDLNDTMYRINESGWVEYTTPFILNSQGIHVLEWRCNASPTYSVEIKIDWSPPTLSNFSHIRLGVFKWQFTVDAADELSGVYCVQFPFDTSIDSEPPYQHIWMGWYVLWMIRCLFAPSYSFIHAWDNAGNHGMLRTS